MNSLLLTDEEVNKILTEVIKKIRTGVEGQGSNLIDMLLQAQAKKWVEWLKRHNDFNECGGERKGAGLLLTIKNYQALKKEIEQ